MSQQAQVVPGEVTTYAAVLRNLDPVERLFDVLSPEVEFTFAGRVRRGPQAVMEHLSGVPRTALSSAEFSFVDRGDEWLIRFTGQDGTPLPSPGGPIDALDWMLTLDEQGLIVGIGMHPHHREPSDLSAPPGAGESFPEFALPDVFGDQVSWYEPDASAHVVIWTCNVCPWALGWHDRLQDVARDYAGRGVRTIQINANDSAVSPGDAPEKSRQRVEGGDFASPYLLDEGQQAARMVGARHTPEVFVVDRSGQIAYHGAPDGSSEQPDLRAEWLRHALDSLLAGEQVDVAETVPTGCTIKWTM